MHWAGNNLPGIASQFAMHFYMTAIQHIFCDKAVFLHRNVQNLVWNICLLTEVANQIWRGKLFPAQPWKLIVIESSGLHTCLASSIMRRFSAPMTSSPYSCLLRSKFAFISCINSAWLPSWMAALQTNSYILWLLYHYYSHNGESRMIFRNMPGGQQGNTFWAWQTINKGGKYGMSLVITTCCFNVSKF